MLYSYMGTCWRPQMEMFSALLDFCAGNSPATGEFPSQRPVTRSFDVFFDLRLNKRLSKQSIRRLFGTPSRSLWRHCIVFISCPLCPLSVAVVFVLVSTCSYVRYSSASSACDRPCRRLHTFSLLFHIMLYIFHAVSKVYFPRCVFNAPLAVY